MSLAPSKLHYRKDDAVLEITWHDGTCHELTAEFLRVHSPSAEVRGHGVGQETLQTGKRDVQINGLEPTGRYAIKIVFSDGHDSGLYDWKYLRELGDHQQDYWQRYLDKLEAAGASRQPLFINFKSV